MSINFVKRFPIRYFIVRKKSESIKMKIEKMASVFSCDEEKSYEKAVECLMNGDVIGLPTDTVYGLACNANSPEAIKKLYTLKGRDSAKPIALCVTYISDIRKWGEASHLSDSLLHSLLPGPVTVVLQKSKYLDNPYLNPQTTQIGIRIPKCNFLNKVTKVCEVPVALTSANSSSEPSSLCVKEFEHLYAYLGAVFDGGTLSQGLDQNRTGSTVIDLSKQGNYSIIRKGISCETIVSVLESHGLTNIVE